MENYGKPKKNKDKAKLRKPDCESGSRLRVGKVSASHSARPKTVPLTEQNKMSVIFGMFIFHKKCKQDIFCFDKGSRQGLSSLLRIFIGDGESGLCSSMFRKDYLFENLIFFNFEIFMFFNFSRI